MKPADRAEFLDYWRALAIICVLFGHVLTPHVLNAGRMGVELFFTLSGRLIAEVLFVKSEKFKVFAIKRAFRILPSVVIYCVAIFVLGVAGFLRDSYPIIMASITFSYNYFSSFWGRDILFDHTWSLAVEVHMYLLLSLVAFAVRRKIIFGAVIIFLVALAMIFWGAYLSEMLGVGYYNAYWRSDVRGASILIGAGFYLLLKADFIASMKCRSSALFIFSVATLLQLNMVPDFLKYSLGSIGFAYVLCCGGAVTSSMMGDHSHKIMLRIAAISYSIYIWQQPLLSLDLFWRITCLPLVFVVAILSNRYIEVPFVTYGRKLAKRSE